MAQTGRRGKRDESALLHSNDSDLEQSKDFKQESAESTSERSFELDRKKLAILIVSVVIIVLIIVFSILVFGTTKNPKFRVRSIAIENLNYSTYPSPSFNMRFAAEMTVKNKNFGHFSYGITNVTLAYRGKQVGQVLVPKGRVRALGTRKINAAMDLNSNNVRNDTYLGGDIRSEFLTLTAQSKMNGKVYLMSAGKRRKVNGRRRSAAMKCTLTVNLAKKLVQDIMCS